MKIFTDKDFDSLKWHDCRIHSIWINHESKRLFFDIDYISKWEGPFEDKTFGFEVAPATLVFHAVWDVRFELECYTNDLTFDFVDRAESKKLEGYQILGRDIEWKWQLVFHEGEIALNSVGFELYLREPVSNRNSQSFSIEERGGVCFDIPESVFADEK